MFSNIIRRSYCSGASFYSDVVICGGGLIGTTTACALAKHPWFVNKTITLIESTAQHEFVRSQTYSNRVSAISPFSQKLFDRLGVWKNVQRYKEVHDMKIWGVYHDNFLGLDNSEEGVLAYIVENGEIIQAVCNELCTLKNLTMLHEKSISSVNIDQGHLPSSLPKVLLKDGTEYSCQLLIGADGVNSVIRKAMNIDYMSWDYHQMGVVATLNISECCSNTTAWQRFLPDGPVALLPLSGNLSSLVWSTTKEKALDLLKLSNEEFVDALNTCLKTERKPNQFVNTTSNVVHSILNSLAIEQANVTLHPPVINSVIDGSRAVFPLGFGHSPSYVCSNVVLIGDAAHRVHPLAGQGVNLGFKDIDTLEKVLSESLRNGKELGNIIDLKKYESLCQQNNIPVMAFIELIHRIYTSETSPVQALGEVCIQLAGSCRPLKGIINSKALFLRT